MQQSLPNLTSVSRFLSILQWLPAYEKRWLRPDMVRCVQDMVMQRCVLEVGDDREMLDGICRQLDGILDKLEKMNCRIQ